MCRLESEGFVTAVVDGSMSMQQRRAELERFNTNADCSVFLLSMRTGAVGLTLTAASEGLHAHLMRFGCALACASKQFNCSL